MNENSQKMSILMATAVYEKLICRKSVQNIPKNFTI